MGPLTPEVFNFLDQGVALCSVDDLEILDANSTIISWLNIQCGSENLTSCVHPKNLSRIKNAILKRRTYRFSQPCYSSAKADSVEVICKVVVLEGGRDFLLIQASINNSEERMKSLVNHHSILLESSNQLLQREKLKAEEACRAKSQFFAAMSHELRTPLNGILGMVQQLTRTGLSSSQTYYLETINESGQQLLSVINQVLDYSKIESSNLILNPVATDLKSLISQVVQICGGQGLSGNVALSSRCDMEVVPLVYVDDVRFKQVLINLVNNALKFTREGSVEVRLKMSKEARGDCNVQLSVIDTGVGISEDKVNTIFEPFTQETLSTTRKYGGTGLGLSISKQIIDLMGGEIAVTSKFGYGSCFHIGLSLGISDEAKPVVGACDGIIVDRRFIEGKSILIVDDIALNREIIKMPLTEMNTHLFLAENGIEAVEVFQQNDIDLILMDCLMPIMDGFEATKLIRDSETNGNRVPIFAVTASISDELTQTCRAAGMDEVLLKPFDFDELIDRICAYFIK